MYLYVLSRFLYRNNVKLKIIRSEHNINFITFSQFIYKIFLKKKPEKLLKTTFSANNAKVYLMIKFSQLKKKKLYIIINICMYVYLYYGFINVVIHQKQQYTKTKVIAPGKKCVFFNYHVIFVRFRY